MVGHCEKVKGMAEEIRKRERETEEVFCRCR
jgi:hypothetical protein